jgi:mono/diheme cytochrome c family protein
MKIVKLLAKLLVSLVVVLVLAFGAVFFLTERRIGATYEITPVSIETSADSATLVLGQHVADVRGCTDCHNPDLSGRTFLDEGPIATVTGSNLTSGRNGKASTFSTDEDWVRAIRHGVRPDGSALMVMPSYEYGGIGPEDLGALVSWIKSMPPVDTEPVEQRLGPLGRILYAAGQLPLLAAEMIDHDALGGAPFEQPDVGVTAEYGEYIALSCTGCHSPTYAGGPIPGMPPDYPAAGNLTPDMDSGIGAWTEDDFMSFFATGVRPDGRQVETLFMPWEPLGQAMTETELQAIWTFLRTLAPAPKGGA